MRKSTGDTTQEWGPDAILELNANTADLCWSSSKMKLRGAVLSAGKQ